MKVIVLGAGVIGVVSAYFLAKAGHEVAVLEKNSEAAMGCSHANGGQLSYSHIETWAAKSSLFSDIKSALLPNSFLSVSKFTDKNFLRFAGDFYKNSNEEKAKENSRKLFHLSSYSRKILQEILTTETGIKFDYQTSGILHFYRNKEKFDHAVKEAEFASSIGCRLQILTAEECVKKEPTLVKIFDENKLVGGVFYENDASGNCELFTKSLAKICSEKYGVFFRYNTEVKNILTNHKKITGINSGDNVFVADAYVYALGAYGVRLLDGIKIDSKIYPLKGYSLSIPADKEFIAPKMSLTDPENKIVYSRIGNIFRAAGTVEIDGLRNRKNDRMVDFLSSMVRASFSDFGNFNEIVDWYGFRPFRPNSIPLICEVKKYGNLFINSGHGSLGWMLAAASGKIVASLVLEKKDQGFSFLQEELEEF